MQDSKNKCCGATESNTILTSSCYYWRQQGKTTVVQYNIWQRETNHMNVCCSQRDEQATDQQGTEEKEQRCAMSAQLG